GQTISKSANPLNEISATDGIPSQDEITALFDEWNPDAIIVGIPYNMDGSPQEITHAAKKFGNRLQHQYQRPVYFVDERLTTVEAKAQLGHPSRAVDSYAAKLILETWFREHDNEKN
ncbi:MAG: Holliday junction resolvase RuvX, partial [Coxiellaceae bacterium]|nr:Holliday junction resolvase RuvX [Coxiellaceae bacterium]